MTQDKPSLSPETCLPTLATLLDRLGHVEGITPQTRANLRSAVKTLCRVLDKQPDQIMADGGELRQRIANALPQTAGVGPRRWANVKSDLRRALEVTGLKRRKANKRVLSPQWLAAAETAPEIRKREVLMRFGRYSQSRGIEPEAVTEATFDAYLAYLEADRLSRSPWPMVSRTYSYWNKYVVPAGLGRAIERPVRKEVLAVKWSEVPSSLLEEVTSLFARLQSRDFFDPDTKPPIANATAKTWDGALRRLIGWEVASGTRLHDLTSLKAVLNPARVQPALAARVAMAGNKTTPQLGQMSWFVYCAARKWTDMSETDLAQLRRMADRLSCRRVGLTAKNQARLAQFQDDGALRDLISLPERLMQQAARKAGTKSGAYRAQAAVAIGILLSVPLRIKNLLNLDRDKHFVRRRFQGETVLHLVVPKEEVKNHVDLEVPLRPELAHMIDEYMARYHPLLTTKAQGFLFPGRGDAPVCHTSLRKRIIDTVRREAGAVIHPHLVRHLAAYIYLEACPGDYETVRRLLGHKSLNTTIGFYAGLETSAAAARYDAILMAHKDGTTEIRT